MINMLGGLEQPKWQTWDGSVGLRLLSPELLQSPCVASGAEVLLSTETANGLSLPFLWEK